MTETPEQSAETTQTELVNSGAEQSVEMVGERTQDPAGDDTDTDTFPRDYVEKLRKESAKYRVERDQLAEQLNTAHRERIDDTIKTLGVKPAAVWATVNDPADLLNDDGQPDSGKIRDAVTAAKETLGIKPEKVKLGLRSGAVAPQPPRNTWAEAFKPPHKR